MNNPNIEPGPRQTLLPLVAEEIKYSVATEFDEHKDLIGETYWRMFEEQPETDSSN